MEKVQIVRQTSLDWDRVEVSWMLPEVQICVIND